MIYPFVENPAPVDFETADGIFKAYRLLRDKGGFKSLTKEEKEFVVDFFGELWRPEAYRTGIYRIVGWEVNFRPFMRRFLVHTKYYGWREIWSFNKSAIRKNAVHPSHILKIVEIPINERKVEAIMQEFLQYLEEEAH